MKFTVLSHAGLLVQNNKGKSLICDPWLIGSSYWRSWWNYPPVNRELVNSLKPDYIYLTHIHWDHFHGPSLEKFAKETPIIVPKGNYSRIKNDLNYLGFNNIVELKHGEKFNLDDDFSITSYQFWMFLDSALMIEIEGSKLLNLNDSKHMGPTLRQIIHKHKPIDFVFRSHSSANERLSYNIVDDPDAEVDDLEKYVKEFALTATATGAKYAIPFASNHCHLHKDSYHFNKYVQTPQSVKTYFDKHNISSPEVKVMVSGDSWCSQNGFRINDKDWFGNREVLLQQYYIENKESLQKFYAEEDKTEISKESVNTYFKTFAASLPYFVKRYFKDKKFTYVLSAAGTSKYIFNVNISTGKVDDLPVTTDLDYHHFPIQIHTTAFIFQRGIDYKIFSHMCIGKRVFYKVTKAEKKYMEALNLLFNCYEYDLIPMRKIFTSRSLQSWAMRWREVWLYSMLAKDQLLYKNIDIAKYLKPVKTMDRKLVESEK